jgi:hypothetical protein
MTDTSMYSPMKSGHLPPLPMATGTIVTQMTSVLSTTLMDLHVRNEVGDCIQDMLLDVETTYHLQQQLELESTQRLLEKAQTEQQGVTLEAHTERLERHDHRVDLADRFVVELLQLNREMKELLTWKEAHGYKVRNYDFVLAKLARTEDELREANSGAKPRRAEDEKVEETESNMEKNIEQSSPAETIELTPENTPEETTIGTMTTTTATTDIAEKEPDDTLQKTSTEMDQKLHAITEGGLENTNSVEEDQKSPPAAAAVVSIDVEADIEENVPTLLTLDMEPLMMVFGFLDAMDILNTAQMNLTMYNKVDNIFGISEDGQSPPAPRPPPTPSKPAATGKQSTNTTTTATNYAMKPTPQKNKSAVSAGSSSTSTATGGIGSGLFSMLQPAKPEAAMAPAAKASTASSSSGQQHQSQPLNAKVAQSMASKLSDAELSAIISMTDKLSKLEKEAHMLRNEREVFAGKLEGTEAVKQFLIGKVRDVEVKLQRSKEDEIKVTQQIASDQEVIAFLDSRVQELEQQTETLTLEMTATQAGFDDLKVSSSKKIIMLSDMLKYEREKLREDEGDWKATKKVLVKEVKSCRAQILALQAERDGLKEQNDMLKRAVVSTGSGGSNSGKHHNGSGGGRKSYGSP